MGKKERQVNDGGVQEAGEWWGRARDRHVMGESKRQASDGREQETVGRMMGKSERQANDGEE